MWPNEWWSVSNTMGEHTCLLKDYDYFLTLSKMSKTCYDEDEDEGLPSPLTLSIFQRITWHVLLLPLLDVRRAALWCLISNLLLFFCFGSYQTSRRIGAGADEGQFIFLTNDLALRGSTVGRERKLSLLLVFFYLLCILTANWWPCNRSFVPGDFSHGNWSRQRTGPEPFDHDKILLVNCFIPCGIWSGVIM